VALGAVARLQRPGCTRIGRFKNALSVVDVVAIERELAGAQIGIAGAGVNHVQVSRWRGSFAPAVRSRQVGTSTPVGRESRWLIDRPRALDQHSADLTRGQVTRRHLESVALCANAL